MGIQIPLKDSYYLTSDKHGYQLTMFAGYDKNEAEIWRPQKFAGTIDRVLQSWAEQMIRECDATSFEELKARVSEISETLAKIHSSIHTEAIGAASKE